MSWYKNEIPKEYKKLEYIQSTGTQYIDTGIPLSSNSRIVMDCELTTVSGTQCFFCSRTEATTTDITSNTLFAVGSTYRKEYYGESKTATNSEGANKRIIIDNNKNEIKLGNTRLTFSSVDDITSPMNCYLMASTILENGAVGAFSNFAYMKLYSCQIYDNDVLLRNFVPCQRKSDNVLGLFDIVEQSFCINGGTGIFNFKELIAQSKMYIGVENQSFDYIKRLSKTIDKIYFPFNNTIKTVLRGYIGVNNLSKLCFSAGTQLGSLSIGNTIEVPVITDWQDVLGKQIIFKVVDKNHEGYPDESTCLATDKIIITIPFDSSEPKSSNTYQQIKGNNNFALSNLFQWLNSTAIAGEWYKPMHDKDSAPIAKYNNLAGFLYMLDPKFTSKLLITTLSLWDGSSNYSTFTAKMFLPSTDELGISKINEGKVIKYYDIGKLRNYVSAYPTQECVSNSSYKSSNFSTSKSWYWWTRTPYYTYTYLVMITGLSVKSNSDANSEEIGICPFCNLPNNTLLSKEPNANGHYTLL